MRSPSARAGNSSAISPIRNFVSRCRWPRRQRLFSAGVGSAGGDSGGESRTYGEMARRLRTAPRAIGGACGANPIALVIPCHRVVGSQGSLGGFMGVTDGDPIAIKRWLLHTRGLSLWSMSDNGKTDG